MGKIGVWFRTAMKLCCGEFGGDVRWMELWLVGLSGLDCGTIVVCVF